MPWKECSVVSLREEFVRRALEPGCNRSALCREFGVSRNTGYRWLRRGQVGWPETFVDHSRRPHSSPGQTCAEMEERIVQARKGQPTWGARKIRAHLISAA